jgi:hypothetical protein
MEMALAIYFWGKIAGAVMAGIFFLWVLWMVAKYS